MRWVAALLVLLAGAAWAVKPNALVKESATPPSTSRAELYKDEHLPLRVSGAVWMRTTDWRAFTYSDSLDRWVGSPMIFWGSKNATGVTGFLKFGQAVAFDTTSADVCGHYIPDDGILTRVWWTDAVSIGGAANCTLKVIVKRPAAADTSVVVSENWGADHVAFPNCVVDSGAVTTLYIAGKSAGGVNPDYPNVWFEFVPTGTP